MRLVKNTFFALVTSVVFLLPYSAGPGSVVDTWWKFFPSTVTIVGVFWLFRRESYLTDLGLKISARQFGYSTVILVVMFVVTRIVIFQVAGEQGLVSGADRFSVGWRFVPLFQALNEEMLFRAVLLTYLLGRIKSPNVVSVAAALLFSLSHFIFYQWGSQQTAIPGETLLTLFLVAWAMNETYLRTRHIGYAYAIHLGWNLNKFGEQLVFEATGEFLQEADSFARIEGDWLVVGLAALLLVVVFFLMRKTARTEKRKQASPT